LLAGEGVGRLDCNSGTLYSVLIPLRKYSVSMHVENTWKGESKVAIEFIIQFSLLHVTCVILMNELIRNMSIRRNRHDFLCIKYSSVNVKKT
jgi:hypothetical protein